MTFLLLKVVPNLSRRILTRDLTTPSQTHIGKKIILFDGKDAYINRLCDSKLFKEAIDILCGQSRLREA
ncbi:hypothetical protein Csa_014672, partial [Cucumis sativus]